jgi:hypothetical protein
MTILKGQDICNSTRAKIRFSSFVFFIYNVDYNVQEAEIEIVLFCVDT